MLVKNFTIPESDKTKTISPDNDIYTNGGKLFKENLRYFDNHNKIINF